MSEQKFAIEASAQRIIDADRDILEVFGMQVVHAYAGRCVVQAQVPPKLINAAGFAHGSIAYALLDTACAYALASISLRGVTVHGDTTYVAAAKAEDSLMAQVDILSHSRRTASLRGECYIEGTGDKKLCAHGSFVFQLITPRT